MKVLIADGSVHILERLESLILEEVDSVSIITCLSIPEALRRFNECNPEVVLINMDMATIQSFGLIKHINSSEGNTVIVALSINVVVNIREYSKRIGANYFLDKYNEFDKIPGILKSLAKKKVHFSG